MITATDLYITSKDDTHLWNSVSLNGDLTDDQKNNTRFRVCPLGIRQNELDNNVFDETWQVVNQGTASYDYILQYRTFNVGIK
jgi:hypothetical protein